MNTHLVAEPLLIVQIVYEFCFLLTRRFTTVTILINHFLSSSLTSAKCGGGIHSPVSLSADSVSSRCYGNIWAGAPVLSQPNASQRAPSLIFISRGRLQFAYALLLRWSTYCCMTRYGLLLLLFILFCLLYTSPSPRDGLLSRMPSSA